jgi:glycosyltransferase involved in cell wall biosynthesis
MNYLWTQAGLASATWTHTLDVLWIPAHTLPVLRKPGLKTVVTIHGLEYTWLPEYKNLLQRWYLPLSTYYAARHATKLIAVSQFTRHQLLEETGIESSHIDVVYEGVESVSANRRIGNSEKNLSHRWGIEDNKYILFVGTLQPRKNLPALIEAFSRAAGTLSDKKLVIAGGKGWQTADIFEAVTRYNCTDRVIFTGRVSDDDVRELYRSALLYVQPSLQEGFGLPLLEAMKADIPVISSDGGALPEVLGKAGILVPLGNDFVAKLAEAITTLATNAGTRAELIRNGRRRVSELTWEQTARATLESILSALRL